MEIFIVSFFVFLASVCALAVTQWIRKGPVPVGCVPANGECCRLSGVQSDSGFRDNPATSPATEC